MPVVTDVSPRALADNQRTRLFWRQRALLACGVLSSLLYVISIDVIAALRYPDYHDYTSQMVSELMAVGAPTRTLLIWLFVPYNLFVFAFATGVWASAEGKRATRLAGAALVAYGVVSTAGLLLTPMDLRGTVDSSRDTLHIAATFVMSLFIVAVMAFGAFAHRTRFRLYSFGTIATVVVFGALAGYLAGPMPGPTPWVGIAERVNIYATMLWILVFAVSLLRGGALSPGTNDEDSRCAGGTIAHDPSRLRAEPRSSIPTITTCSSAWGARRRIWSTPRWQVVSMRMSAHKTTPSGWHSTTRRQFGRRSSRRFRSGNAVARATTGIR